MAVHRIPLASSTRSPFFEQRTALDGREYVLRFQWNARRERWTFDLLDESEVPILSGRLLGVGSSLLRRVTDERRPPGVLMLVDGSDRGQELTTLDGLGPDSRWQLYYLDAEEIAGGGWEALV